MDNLDTKEGLNEGISTDEDLMMREVIKGDADLYFLHTYLTDIFRNRDNF